MYIAHLLPNAYQIVNKKKTTNKTIGGSSMIKTCYLLKENLLPTERACKMNMFRIIS